MRKLSGIAALAIGALLLIGVPGAAAKTYRPNTTSDHAPNGCTKSDCTLREAVIAANNVIRFDVIVLRPGKVYKRSQAGTNEDLAQDGDLDVTDALRIETPKFVRTKHGRRAAKRATIDANNNERVIDAGAELTLTRVVVRHGDSNDSGGGIYTTAPLNLLSSAILDSDTSSIGGALRFNPGSDSVKLLMSHALVKGNTATGQSGGVYLDGPAKIVDSVLEDNASTDSDTGAIHTHYDADVIRTTITGNHSSSVGGGIYNHGGVLTVRDSTISANFTLDVGAGGGGIYSEFPMSITNSTIANNKATGDGAGIKADSGTVTMNGVTIVRNRAASAGSGNHAGGFYDAGVNPQMKNSIIALNTVGGASTNPDCFGAFNSGGHNLLGILTAGCTGFIASGDLIGGQLKLGKLKSNGGPTKTVALLKGSRAINHGGADAPARDQRGRKKKGKRDIGAFEYKGSN